MRPVVGSFELRGERLTLRPASLDDVPAIVAFHRVGVPDPGEDASSIDWFSTGGPWMHEYFCSRHVRVYQDLGWDCWVVERGDGTIAGSVEICYAVEPPPFGRYAHLELLELDEHLLCDEVEEWVLDRSEAQARDRGYDRFWCRPEGSGGSPEVLARRGYAERWRNGWLTVSALERVEAPPHDDGPLLGDYDREASHLLALNHRESASYRWRYLWRPVLAPAASDFPTDVAFSGRRVTPRGRPSANLLVNIWSWRDSLSRLRSLEWWESRSAWIDLWVEPGLATDAGYVADLVAAGCRQASSMGASRAQVVVPESIVGEIERRFDADRAPLEAGDPWLMKRLA